MDPLPSIDVVDPVLSVDVVNPFVSLEVAHLHVVDVCYRCVNPPLKVLCLYPEMLMEVSPSVRISPDGL